MMIEETSEETTVGKAAVSVGDTVGYVPSEAHAFEERDGKYAWQVSQKKPAGMFPLSDFELAKLLKRRAHDNSVVLVPIAPKATWKATVREVKGTAICLDFPGKFEGITMHCEDVPHDPGKGAHTWHELGE